MRRRLEADISYPVGELSKTKYVDQLQSFIVPHLSIYIHVA